MVDKPASETALPTHCSMLQIATYLEQGPYLCVNFCYSGVYDIPHIAHYKHNKNEQCSICWHVTVQANRLHTGSCLCCNYGQFKTTNPLKCDILPHNTRNETKQYPETKAWEMHHKKDFIVSAEVSVVQSAEHWGSRPCKARTPLA